jgi:hypothetical protein
MSDISPSSIRTDAQLEKALKEASTSEEMKVILAEAAVSQGLVRRDIYDPSVLIPTGLPQPRRFAKSIEVGGVKKFFEGDSEIEVERDIAEFFRQQLKATTTETRTELTRDERGRFTADQGKASENVVDKVELELMFKRGEISAADYLEQSGAIERHLESRGISVDDLKASVQEKQAERYAQSWESATQEFLNSPEGASWPGGQENLKTVGELIQQMDAENAEDKLEALTQAFRYMRENNLVAENPELTARTKLSEAQSVEEIRQIASSMFGR